MLAWPPRQHPQHGFTLIELIIGVVILAILLVLAAPSAQVMLENSKIRSAAEGLRTGLQLARSEAVRRNAPVALTPQAGGDTGWTIGCSPVNATTCPDATIQTRTRGEERSDKIRIQPNGTTVVFNNMGTVTTPGAPTGCGALAVTPSSIACFTVITTSGIAASTLPLAVVVELGGKVKICNPAVAIASDTRSCAN